MRNKFVYSCSKKKKFHGSGFYELLESILCIILLVVEAFSLHKVVKMLEEVAVGWWEVSIIWQIMQNFIHSSIYSTFKQLLVWWAVRHCHGEELGPFCWPTLVVGIAVISASHGFAEHTSQMRCFYGDSESCGVSDRQQTTKQWPWSFSDARLASGSALELLLSPTTKLVILVQPLGWSVVI